jgi:hypothetical protein
MGMPDRCAAARHTVLAATTLGLLAACHGSDPHPSDAGVWSSATDAAADAAIGVDGLASLDAGMRSGLDAGAPRALDAGKTPASVDASFPTCRAAADCSSARTVTSTLEGCCTDDHQCGLDDLQLTEQLREVYNMAIGVPPGTRCVPLSKLFAARPTYENKRVPIADGGQLLISTDCPTVYFSSLPFRGCCLPSNECAVSTYPVSGELGVLLNDGSQPFAQLECVTSEQLNAQFKASALAAVGNLPATSGSCDYAVLDETLPREPP